MKPMRRFLLFLLALLPLLAVAQQEMEIIPLRHRPVEQVLPILRPLLEPGGVLSGMNNQLILRASRKNREEIKQALAALDTQARSLLIRVTQNRDAVMRQRGGEVYGRVGSGDVRVVQPPSGAASGGGRVEIRRNGNVVGGQVVDTQSTRTASTGQSVQVLEGSRAWINVGQSLPLPLRQMVVGPGGAVVTESVVYRDIGQGFYAEPRLSGDRVTLEISPQYDTPASPNQGYGSVNTQRLSTTVSGRLGEWIELGGSGQQAVAEERGNLSVGTSDIRDNRGVWLMVEEVKP